LWLHSLKVAELLRSAACLHINQSRSYLNHLVFISIHKVFVVKYETEICNNFNCSKNPKSQRKATNNRFEDSGMEPDTEHGQYANVLARVSGK